MKLVRMVSFAYTNKRKSRQEWKYRFVMDDFGNAVMLERNVQNYFHSMSFYNGY